MAGAAGSLAVDAGVIGVAGGDDFCAVGVDVFFAEGIDSVPHPQKSRTSGSTKARNGFMIGPLFGLS
ncbi:MAG: hypothetical protein COA78_18565 [Blastopirellula sp.]|nr:MAG: hypothetical protein COA78_18565 [Blastopirellula sp.]